MSMFNDIDYEIKDNQQKHVSQTQQRLLECAKQFKLGHRCFFGFGQEKVWYRKCTNKTNGAWDHTARKMSQKFEEVSHPILECAEPFLKVDLRSKKGQADHGTT